jgi:hypothetical protein
MAEPMDRPPVERAAGPNCLPIGRRVVGMAHPTPTGAGKCAVGLP